MARFQCARLVSFVCLPPQRQHHFKHAMNSALGLGSVRRGYAAPTFELRSRPRCPNHLSLPRLFPSQHLVRPRPRVHTTSQVRYELRERGFYNLQFIEDEAPFQVNACRDGERFHLHIDWYGRITEQSPLGPCGDSWRRRSWRRSYDDYGRY